jgi:hypothetical protein
MKKWLQFFLRLSSHSREKGEPDAARAKIRVVLQKNG